MVKTVITLILGAGLGAGGMYLYLNSKYEKQNAENLKQNREFYQKKMDELKKEFPEEKDISEDPKEEIDEAKKKAEDLAAKLNYNALYNKEPLGQAAETREEQIFLISPEQYDSETLLDKRILTYWEGDDILSDELSDEILDIENIIGIENVAEFGNSFEEDPYIMHIRNNKFGAVYEVTKDERSYSAVVGDAEE